jgi:hypothetical protein
VQLFDLRQIGLSPSDCATFQIHAVARRRQPYDVFVQYRRGATQVCKTCGIKAFYIPRSNPDGFDVNVRCLEPQPRELTVEPFDGRNWEHHGAELAHYSKE